MVAQNEAALKLGNDRYSKAECAMDAGAIRMAHCLENSEWYVVPEHAKHTMRDRVGFLFSRIPVPVAFVAGEPYYSCEEMAKDVYDNHLLRVRHHLQGPLGHDTEKWRAVHDYWGHVVQEAPFSLSGELAAFSRHMVQFPRVCWPYIRSNVVLENAFRLNRGHFLCYSNLPHCPAKIVFDREFFDDVGAEDWHQRALMEG